MEEAEKETRLADLRKSQAGLEAAKAFMPPTAFEEAWRNIQQEIERLVITEGGAYIEGDVRTGGDFVGHDQNKLYVQGSISGGVQVVGDGNAVSIQSQMIGVDPNALRRDYLNTLFESADILQLSGIDPKAAHESNASLSLGAVYTALLTLTLEDQERSETNAITDHPQHQLSALDLLNNYPRLVLLGEPGSGKSTFVNFVILCLSGEALKSTRANLTLLTEPLPQEEGEKEYSKPQHWSHGTLLPVRVVLRDFAARGLPTDGERITAKNLWDFIARELEVCNLGNYVPHLDKELHEQGGLLLIDGLDEVPEADQHRSRVKQAIESFARSYPKVHILVTSRTYAYQKLDWQLNGFQVASLAPFNGEQIEYFVSRWYKHIASIRKLSPEYADGQASLLRKAIFGNNRLRELAERPLLLTLMASLHAWRGGSLPEKREELYADAVDLLLDSWESQRIVRGPKGEFLLAHPSLVEWLKVDRQKIRDLLNELAYQAHSAQPELFGTADVPQTALIDGLMRIANNSEVNPARLIEYLRDRTGLLLMRGDGIFTFPHRTFQEYLAACYITDHLEPDQIVSLFFQDLDRWREVLLLAAAKATKGMALGFWALIDELCPLTRASSFRRKDAPFWGAYMASQALVENAALQRVSERNRARVERVRDLLVSIVQQETLPVRERVAAGNNLAELGDSRFRPDAWYLPDDDLLGFVEIPAGPFMMGSDHTDRHAKVEEQPQHQVELRQFLMARYPVTVAQFRSFVSDSGYSLESQDCFGGAANHPIARVTWHDAMAYCNWLTGKLATWSGTPEQLRTVLVSGGRVLLPSEAEWEKAARGGLDTHEATSVQRKSSSEMRDGLVFPWGNKFDPGKANTSKTDIGTTCSVGCFPSGASPYGILDLVGNVRQWTRSLWGEKWGSPEWNYPYDPTDSRREDLMAGENVLRVLRGGSWPSGEKLARCASRRRYKPSFKYKYVGFRVSIVPLSSLQQAQSFAQQV